jgi:trans-2-enoyl-CoA reductase
MSLPHWIKWNKVKGKYEINNNMDCFEQSKKMIKISLTQTQLEELSFLLYNQLTLLSEEEQDEDIKRTQTVLKQIGSKISKAESKL